MATKTASRGPQTIPVDISGGEWTGGDPSAQPPNTVRRMRNLVWENAWVSRPPFTYDNLTAIRGLTPWEDDSSKATRLVAIDSSGTLKAKNATGETWGTTGSGTVGGTRLTSATTYRNILYGMQETSNLPTAAFSFDGTTVSSTPFNSAVVARSIVAFKDRLFLFYPRVTITPQVRTDANENAYDFTRIEYASNGLTITNITISGETVCRLSPTSTGASACDIIGVNNTGGFAVGYANIGTASHVRARWDLRPTHATYRVPMTLELVVKNNPSAYALDARAVGYIITRTVGGVDYIFRVSTAGTEAGAEPVWSATPGSINTWGTCDYTNIGNAIVGSLEFFLPNATEAPGWRTYTVAAELPKSLGVNICPRLKFYNSTTTALTTLAPVDASLQDGKADGAIGKSNKGLQLTLGEFTYPFFNCETATSATVDLDDIVWTEVGEPSRILGENFYNVRGSAGYPTAARVAGERIIMCKRRSLLRFMLSEDPRIVILPEGDELFGIGCLGDKAMDVGPDGVLYFLDENGFYAMTGNTSPRELSGPAMRRTLFDKSTSLWVESQSSPANRALLCADHKNRRVLIYTQKGIIFCYEIDDGRWSRIVAGTTEVGYQICDMIYNPNTGHVYVAFTESATGTAGLARLDITQSAAADQISSSGTLAVDFDVHLRPIETKPRSDVMVEYLRPDIACTVAGQEATAYYSKDQGANFTATSTPRDLLTTTSNYAPERFYIGQGWGTIMPRLRVVGVAGTGALKLSGVSVDVIARKVPEYPKR